MMLAVRLPPIRQQDNLIPERAAKMETTTTNKEAYKGQRSTPAKPVRPSNNQMADTSPFKSNTENRDSFTPKAIQPVQAFRLKDNNIMAGSVFPASSGYKDDFVTRGVPGRTKSFAPTYKYQKPAAKFSSETTSRNDFKPYFDFRQTAYTNRNAEDHWNETQTVANPPLAQSTYKNDFPDDVKVGQRISFKPPISTLKLGKEDVELSTNYKDDFTFKASSKPKSYAPQPVFVRPGVKMDSSTEAHDRFTGKFIPPPVSCRPKYEVDSNRPPLDAGTVYSDSYKKFRFVSPSEQPN